MWIKTHWCRIVVGLDVIGVLIAALLSLSFTPVGASMRQSEALKLYTDYMTLYTADMTNDWESNPAYWDNSPAYLYEYLIDPALVGARMLHSKLYDPGDSVTAVGTPYFAVTKWAPLSDPVDHPDAAAGLTVCYVQGNLMVVDSILPNYSTSTGPGPTGHVVQVFFKYSKGQVDDPRVRLRIYDFTDITPNDGTCPLS